MSANPSLQMNRRSLFLLGGAALGLAGCGSMSTQTQIYVLKPGLGKVEGAPVAWSLSIATPYATASLNIDRIALARSNTTLDYFADATWADRLPVVFQNALVESFEASGRIASVSRDTAGLRTDYILETEIRDFSAHYATNDAPPEVAVSINAKLVSLSDRTIAGTFESNQKVAAAENKVPAVVAAFNTAVSAALKEIVEWTLKAPAPAADASAATTPAKPAKPRPHRRRRRAKTTTTTTTTETTGGTPE